MKTHHSNPQRAPRLVPVSPGCIELVGRSSAIQRTQELVKRSAATDGGVLLVGERGVDTESVAREIHARSRASAPWMVINCGTSDARDLERALFGVAVSAPHQPIDLEPLSADSPLLAAGGTVFLQDVTDLPAWAQTRLARIVRDGEVRVAGAPVTLSARLVGSALPTIDADVRANRFRPDLYRRLAAARIDLPALRDRAEDVPELAARLLEDASADDGRVLGFTQAALALLSALTWSGNLAELRAVVDRVSSECRSDVIAVEHLLPALQLDRTATVFSPAGSLREARLRFERDYITAVLQHHGWRVAEAARTLGIQRPNLYRKARQLGIAVVPVPRSSDAG
jgi:DNA-binding NtrC family response regulator